MTYLRLSNHTEASTSIDRQREECAARIEREGWHLVAELADPNVSGAKARENARTALAMLADGRADVLLVAAFDRWSRAGLGAVADLVDVLDEREKAGDPALFLTLRDGISSAAAGWRITAVVIAEVARQERENTSARTTASIARLVREGRWRGGTVPYGYRAEKATDGPGYRLVVDDEQATVVREAARRILEGATAYAVVRDLNVRGVPASREDAEWRVGSLVRLLRSERTVGRVVHRGEVVRDEDGFPAQVWPPLLDAETWSRVRARIGTGGTGEPPAKRRRAARLLSGLVRCASCDGLCYVNSVRGAPAYACVTRRAGSTKCARPVTIQAERLEAYVSETFLDAAGDLPLYERIEYAPEDVELAEIERAIDAATETLRRAATPETFAVLQRLQERREEALARPPEVRTELRPTGQTYREAWAAGDVVVRRRLVSAWAAALILRPATKRGRYSPVDTRVVLIGKPAHVLGVSDAETHEPGRMVVALDDEDDPALG